MKIRDGLNSDISEIIKLFEILDLKHIQNENDFKSSVDNDRYIQLLDSCFNDENYFISIAEDRGKFIGFGIGRLIKIEKHSYLRNSKVGEILYLIIDEAYKLNGFGKNILSDLENKLKQIGADRFKLRVYEFNKEACPEKVNYKKKFTIYEKIAD